MAQYQIYDVKKPRYVRVNTLKLDVETAMFELGKENEVLKDDLIPDLRVLPPGTDLSNHPLVTDGSVFMQGKASSMVAAALGPKPGWEVIDACAAPGWKQNSTSCCSYERRGKNCISTSFA
ncbi:25S rRNA (cytosine-C(5))-methyltransferase NSUN5-like [Bidens hawaiensis]|uniref:25S rRNA (cytosine-C(5))-methyltransferase NSUN5-like n=1 Tax=Bidens hawaiensis TaxID=980011 RepID=UPI00404A8CF3